MSLVEECGVRKKDEPRDAKSLELQGKFNNTSYLPLISLLIPLS